MPGPLPECTDAGWFQGAVKLIASTDDRSAEMYKAAVSKVGQVYQVFEAADVPSRPRARAWIPSKPADHNNILKILQICNPNIPTYDWKVIKTEGGENARMQVVLLLNHECIGPLQAKDRFIKYAFGKSMVSEAMWCSSATLS